MKAGGAVHDVGKGVGAGDVLGAVTRVPEQLVVCCLTPAHLTVVDLPQPLLVQ